jgi:hypothetical protein
MLVAATLATIAPFAARRLAQRHREQSCGVVSPHCLVDRDGGDSP